MKHKGFTLIELLVVISIISLLSSIVLASLNNVRSKARDAARRAAMLQMRNALELYAQDHNGTYPPSSVPWSSSASGANWISGFGAPYISVLPQDPIGGLSSLPVCLPGNFRQYLYASYPPYSNYKIVAYCSPENISATDPLNDPVRGAYAWVLTSNSTLPPGFTSPTAPTNCNTSYGGGSDGNYPICW